MLPPKPQPPFSYCDLVAFYNNTCLVCVVIPFGGGRRHHLGAPTLFRRVREFFSVQDFLRRFNPFYARPWALKYNTSYEYFSLLFFLLLVRDDGGGDAGGGAARRNIII